MIQTPLKGTRRRARLYPAAWMELPLRSVIVVHWRFATETAGKHLETEKKNPKRNTRNITIYSLPTFGLFIDFAVSEDIWTNEQSLNNLWGFFSFLSQLCRKRHVHCDWLHSHWLHWPHPLGARQVWVHPDEVLISPRLPGAGCVPGAAPQGHELFGACHTETRWGSCSDFPGARQQSLCKLPK